MIVKTKYLIFVTLFIVLAMSSVSTAQSCSQNLSLKWSTFQGGNGDDVVKDVFVDPITKEIYTIGHSSSSNLIASNGDLGNGGSSKCYIQCLNPDGTVKWSTIISGWSEPQNIFVNSNSEIILFGSTSNSNLSMNGPGLDKILDGTSDMVYLRLNNLGNTILSSSFIGGNGFESISGLNTNIDFLNGIIYGVVSTSSTDLATSANALDSNPGQVFIFSYDTNSESLPYVSYYKYGGVISSGDEDSTSGEALTVDDDGNIYLILTNASNDYTETSQYITTNGLITSFSDLGLNYLPVFVKLNSTYSHIYGSYMSVISDNGGGPLGYSVSNGVPYWHNFAGFDIEVDGDGYVYILKMSNGFRGPLWNDLSGLSNFQINIGPSPIGTSTHNNNNIPYPTFYIGDHIIKLSANQSGGYQFYLLQHLGYGTFATRNTYEFEVDSYNRINLFQTHNPDNFNYGPYSSHSPNSLLGMQAPLSQHYSPSYEQSSKSFGYYIYEEDSDQLEYEIQPGSHVGNSLQSKIHDAHLAENQILFFGKTENSGYPVTPSYRNDNSQVVLPNSSFSGGPTDGFITVLHSPIPFDNNTITAFDPQSNTFCTDSYIHQNYGPIDGSSISWLSGDGSQSNHIVPDFKKDNITYNHPTQFNSSFIQWQKSYDNITWQDLAGAQQEDFSPLPESQEGSVSYRRLFRSCTDEIESNVITATIAGVNDMTIDVGPAPYQHCTGSNTPLNITISGGSGDISWQWYNGYATTQDINPSSSTSTNGILAEVVSSVDGGGVYRIVVTDNVSGCETEALVTVRDPAVSIQPLYYLCPGQTDCVDIGPSFSDPDITYQWSGPNGFTSTLSNICVTDLGVYTLTLNNCPSTSVTTELIQNAHDSNLTTIPDYTFCQFDSPQAIGMSTSSPAGYTYQWAPTQNISDITAFNPSYNPLLEFPSNPQSYTFTALRQLDGCVFEQNLDIDVNEFVDVNTGSTLSYCTGSNTLGLIDFDGSYVEWEIVQTTFPGGLSGLQADADFSFDGAAQLLSSTISPTLDYPQLSANSYTITIDVKGSSIPFPNSCFNTDVLVLTIYESCTNSTNCTSCPPSSCNWSINANIPPGTDGICSGVDQEVTLGPVSSSNSYEWSIISIDNSPTSNSPLIGIFDQQGVLLTSPGPHPNTVTLDIDNPIPGAYDNIVYEMTTTSINGIVCKDTLKVYSADVYGPIVDLIPAFDVCNIGSSALQSGTSIPFTIDGSFYNSAPNSNIDWNWAGANITNDDTPFPTFNHLEGQTASAYATDILSGCTASDQIEINVEDVSNGAGLDIDDICSGSIVQIGGQFDNTSHSYEWDPPVGLNFPLGTPNSMVPQPYATVDQNITYTLTTTTPACVTEDQMMITTSTAPPPSHVDQDYSSCLGGQIQVVLDPTYLQDCPGCTYLWTHVSGGNISYLNSQTIAEPLITIPATQTNSTVQFQLETTKGNCGNDIMLVTIDVSIPQDPQIPQSLMINCGLPLTPITIANHVAGNEYQWSTINGLYEDANMTIPLSSNLTNLSTIYAYTNAIQNYSVFTIQDGCYSGASIISVENSTPIIAHAGDDLSLCFGTPSGSLGPSMITYSNSTVFNWVPTGISTDPNSNVFSIPTSQEENDMINWLSNTTVLNPIFQQGSVSIGSFEYTLITADGSCSDSDKVIVRVLEDNFPIGFAGQSQNKCIDDCFYLLSNVDPNYNYTWTPFPSSELANMTFPYSNNPLVCPQVDVTYSVYLTENATGCVSDVEMVTYTLNPSPIIDDQLIEICQYDIELDLTSYIPNYATLINPIWTLNDGSGSVITNPTNYYVTADVEFEIVAENQFGCSDNAVITIQNPSTIPNPDTFYKIIGDTDDNVSKKIKFFDDHLYISFDQYIGGQPHASMIKYDRLGNIIWHTTMDYISSINDFVQDEECNIIGVGYKDQFSNAVDNVSLILRFDSDNGSILNSTIYQNSGREELKKIVRKTVGSSNSYYISGTRNPGPSPNSVDMTCLYHYSLNGTLLFNNYYTNDLTQLDEEGDRGLLELSDGNVLLFGNDGPTGYGLIMKINGTTGAFIDGMLTDAIIDFYDAVETVNGDIILVGEKFNDDEGSIVVVDPTLNITSSLKFDNLTDFREIKYTSGSNYLIAGKDKNAEGYPVLFSVDYNSNSFTINNGYYINSFESDYNTFWFDYDELNDKVAYSDTRTDNPNGFGMKDILVGIFDPNLTTLCSQSYVPSSSVDNVGSTSENFNKYGFSLANSSAPNTILVPLLEKDNICGCEDNMVNFDGTNDFLQRSGMTLSGDFTISAWFNSSMLSSGSAEDRIFSIGNSERLEIGIEDGGSIDGELWVYEPDNGSQTTGNTVNDGLWHHVVLTKNAGLTDVYLDGILVYTYNVSATNSYGPLMRIGNWIGGGTSSFFLGDIDEVSIWNVGMSASNVSQISNCTLSGTEPNLIGYYDMDLGISSGNNTALASIPDVSGSGNDLSILNFNLTGISSNLVCSTTDLTTECNVCISSPMAICQNTINVTASHSNDAIVNITDVDDGSFSVCGPVTLSFDPSTIVTEKIYECPTDLGTHQEILYVTDIDGLQSSCAVTVEVSGNVEIEALEALYTSTIGDNWITNTGWLTNCDPCDAANNGANPWYGITCDVNNELITEIELHQNGLSGTLPPEIGDFSSLTRLELTINTISMNLPTEICNLTALVDLLIGKNEFDGPLPSCLSTLGSLKNLYLNDNNFIGSLPDFTQGQNPDIVQLEFDNNLFSGGIPDTYGSLDGLSVLTTHDNDLSGCYPQQLIGLCQNTNLNATSASISDGNSGLTSWDDFCSSDINACCPSTLTIDWSPVLDGTYRSSGDIFLESIINGNMNVILNHGSNVGNMVNFVSPITTNSGSSLIITSNGCN